MQTFGGERRIQDSAGASGMSKSRDGKRDAVRNGKDV